MSEVSVKDDGALEALVGQVADEFLRRQAGGERPDIEEYAARHPEAADVLRKVLASLRLFDASRPSGEPGTNAPGDAMTGTLGDSRLLREVGRGGMGIVYEAEQVSLNRRVALKVLPFAATMDPRHLQRFHNEARAAASLHHEHIVPVYAVGQERGVHYYAMQFIDGPTLAQLIARGRGAPADTVDRTHAPREPAAAPPAPAAQTTEARAADTAAEPRSPADYRAVAGLVAQAAEALEHAHGLGIVHRDVKPGNLMLDGEGKVWVTDFGLARLGTDGGLTGTGDVVGTLRYMSPEQATAKHGLVDHRTDVYGLGATLYELLAGRPAFEGDNPADVLPRVVADEPPPPRSLQRYVPAELETVTLKAMAKDPAERYQSAQELADDLRRWLEDRPIRARRPTLLQRAAEWARRHRAVVWAAGLVLLVAVAALSVSTAWAWHKQKQTDEQRVAAENNAAEADKQRQRATENFRKSVKVLTALLDDMSGKQSSLTPEQVNLASEAALVIEELLAGDAPTDPESRLLIAQAHEGLGTALLIRGEIIEAARQLAQARDLYARLVADFPAESLYASERLRLRERRRRLRPVGLAQVAAEKGLHEVAARAFRDCVLIDQVAESEFEVAVTLQDRAVCRIRLADALRALGQRPEAERAYGEALADCDRLAQVPAIQMWPPLLAAWRARALAGRGLLEAEGGRLERAEADFRQALALVDGLTPDEQEVALMVLHDRARVRSALGNVLWALDRRGEATELFRKAKDEWGKAKSEPVRDNDLAWFLATSPDIHFRNAKEAVQLAQQAVKGTPETAPWRALGVTDYGPWHYRRTLAVALYRAGDWKAAAEVIEVVGKLRERYYAAIRKTPPVSPALEEAVKLQRDRAGADDSIADYFFRTMIKWQQGNKEGARSDYDAAVRGMKQGSLSKDKDLRRFREEAGHLMGIEPDHD
jgi:serine/threonine protein kinase